MALRELLHRNESKLQTYHQSHTPSSKETTAEDQGADVDDDDVPTEEVEDVIM